MDAAEERMLDALLPDRAHDAASSRRAGRRRATADTRQRFRKMLREGELDDARDRDRAAARRALGVEIMAPPGMEEMTQPAAGHVPATWAAAARKRAASCKVREALQAAAPRRRPPSWSTRTSSRRRRCATPSRTASCSSTRSTRSRAAQGTASGADVSREGVQRDLLPLVEGCTVTTKYGMVQDRPHPVHRLRRVPHVASRRT